MIPSCGNQSTPTNERDNTFESPILSGESNTPDIVSDVDAPSLEESTSSSGDLPAPEPPVESSEASAPVDQDENRPDGRNWSSVFAMPTADEINTYQNQSTHRAPYITGWLSIPGDTRYTEYVVDFKARSASRRHLLLSWQLADGLFLSVTAIYLRPHRIQRRQRLCRFSKSW